MVAELCQFVFSQSSCEGEMTKSCKLLVSLFRLLAFVAKRQKDADYRQFVANAKGKNDICVISCFYSELKSRNNANYCNSVLSLSPQSNEETMTNAILQVPTKQRSINQLPYALISVLFYLNGNIYISPKSPSCALLKVLTNLLYKRHL